MENKYFGNISVNFKQFQAVIMWGEPPVCVTFGKKWYLFGPYFRHLVPIFENYELNIFPLILTSGGSASHSDHELSKTIFFSPWVDPVSENVPFVSLPFPCAIS